MLVENEMSKEEYKKALKKAAREKWERVFAYQLDAIGFYLGEDPMNLLPGEYAKEFVFHPDRDWRFDFRICHLPKHAILVDIQGGIWTGGAHVRGLGYTNDIEKMNAATAMGYQVYWFVPEMVEDGSAIKFLEEEVWK